MPTNYWFKIEFIVLTKETIYDLFGTFITYNFWMRDLGMILLIIFIKDILVINFANQCLALYNFLIKYAKNVEKIYLERENISLYN